MSKHQALIDKPIIFIGPGRSGSTIISEFIMVHEQLAWPSNHLEMFPHADWSNHLRLLFDNRWWRLLGEKGQINRTRLFNNYLPRPAEAYPLWERLTRKEINFSRGFLLGETATAGEKARIRAVFTHLVAAQGRQRLAIKITGPGRIGYLKSIFPDAIFINVVRNQGATVRSLLKVPFWKELGMHQIWWQGAYTEAELQYFSSIRDDPGASTAFQLQKLLQTTTQEALQTKANMITVHYEDFLNDPAAVVARILRETGLQESEWITRKLLRTPLHNRNLSPTTQA